MKTLHLILHLFTISGRYVEMNSVSSRTQDAVIALSYAEQFVKIELLRSESSEKMQTKDFGPIIGT